MREALYKPDCFEFIEKRRRFTPINQRSELEPIYLLVFHSKYTSKEYVVEFKTIEAREKEFSGICYKGGFLTAPSDNE